MARVRACSLGEGGARLARRLHTTTIGRLPAVVPATECGNQQCEFGEACVTVGCHSGGECAVDCPLPLMPCPVDAHGQVHCRAANVGAMHTAALGV
jgi:hypothetical protein